MNLGSYKRKLFTFKFCYGQKFFEQISIDFLTLPNLHRELILFQVGKNLISFTMTEVIRSLCALCKFRLKITEILLKNNILQWVIYI